MLIYLNRLQRYNKPSGEQNNFDYFFIPRCSVPSRCGADYNYYKSSEPPNLLLYFSISNSFSTSHIQKNGVKISIYHIKLRYLQPILQKYELNQT